MDQVNGLQETDSRNILIVDDDPDTCDLLDILFRLEGYNTRIVYNGQEAVQSVEAGEPDAVVLDVMMPEMDGWETFRQMRLHSDVPVLFLTAMISGDYAARAFSMGANDYLRKPFQPSELLARIEALLTMSRPKPNSCPPGGGCFGCQGRPTVSVVIPALNEAENLPHVLPYLPMDMIDEVILVDGRSTDDTVLVATDLLPCIKVVMEQKPGKGAALRSGFAVARGDIVVTLDADGSTDPKEIPAFIGALRSGADFVKGTRFVQGAGTLDMPLYRKIGNKALVFAANLLFGARYTDITYGYNATWRCYAPSLALDIDGWACEIISNIRAISNGLRVVEVASIEQERINGEAKLKAFSAGWAILSAMIRERFKRHDKKAARKIKLSRVQKGVIEEH